MKILGNRTLGGFLYGFRQPCLVVEVMLENSTVSERLAERAHAALSAHMDLPLWLPSPNLPAARKESSALMWVIAETVSAIQRAAGMPTGRPRVMPLEAGTSRDESEPPTGFRLYLPSMHPESAHQAFRWTFGFVARLVSATPETDAWQLGREIESLSASIARHAPKGSNPSRFMDAAHSLGIPVLALPGNLLQFGWGRNARLFLSSLSDSTPAIGMLAAKDKGVSKDILRRAGLPVPRAGLAPNEDAAVAIANALGYPVVVKPADQDQGRGVCVRLRSESEVREGFRHARGFSKRVLVETFIAGSALRITVVDGECVSAVLRLPAGVTGNGQSSIAELVAAANRDPRRSSLRSSMMKPIVLDAESLALLAESDMDTTSVPEAGRFVALRNAANVSTGGDMILLEPELVDTGYFTLALRAAALLRLDIAGVDLITRDPRLPWEEAGGAIIEVNAQPQFGVIVPQRHHDVLRRYVPDLGSLPSCIVVGSGRQGFVDAVRTRLPPDSKVGSLGADGLFLGTRRLGPRPDSDQAGVEALLIEPSTGAVLAGLDFLTVKNSGLPLVHMDLAVLAGDIPEAAFRDLLAAIAPHLRRRLLLPHRHTLHECAASILGQDRLQTFADPADMAVAVCEALENQR